MVRVVENPIVNRVAFENNHKLSDDSFDLQCSSGRAPFSRPRWRKPTGRKSWICTPSKRILRRDGGAARSSTWTQNRVDVVFQINDGSATLISKIVIDGNKAFSEDRLIDVINSREFALVALSVDVRSVRSGTAELRQGTAAAVLPEKRLRRYRDARRERRTVARPQGILSSPSRSTRASVTRSARSPSIPQLRNLSEKDLPSSLQ